jgi:hypothetical protein
MSMTEMATVIAVVATGLFGFLSLLVTVVFLWKVYKHGGRGDLTAAARALRESRPQRGFVLARRPQPAEVAGEARRAARSKPRWPKSSTSARPLDEPVPAD